MKLTYKFTHLSSTLALQEYAENKLSALEKYLPKSSAVSARVEFEKTTAHHKKGDIYRCEVNVRINGEVVRAEETAQDVRGAVDMVSKTLQKIFRQSKEKTIADRKRS